MLLRLIEIGFLLVGLVLFTTQLIIPLWVGLPVFPLIGKTRRVEQELARVKEQDVVKSMRKLATKIRNGE